MTSCEPGPISFFDAFNVTDMPAGVYVLRNTIAVPVFPPVAAVAVIWRRRVAGSSVTVTVTVHTDVSYVTPPRVPFDSLTSYR